MGLYMFVTNEDRISKRKVSDAEINEEFQAALKYDPSLMIEQYERRIKGSLFYKKHILFNIYHETPAHDGSPYQARFQTSASGQRVGVIAYLHGIINGAIANKLKNENLQQ